VARRFVTYAVLPVETCCNTCIAGTICISSETLSSGIAPVFAQGHDPLPADFKGRRRTPMNLDIVVAMSLEYAQRGRGYSHLFQLD
jgi:hypothetical protein